MPETNENPAAVAARGASGNIIAGAIDTPENSVAATRRQRLPNRRRSEIVTFEHEGHRYRASVSRFANGSIAEVFLDASKFGSDTAVMAQDSAILASIAMQHGVPASTICAAIRGPIGRALALFQEGGA